MRKADGLWPSARADPQVAGDTPAQSPNVCSATASRQRGEDEVELRGGVFVRVLSIESNYDQCFKSSSTCKRGLDDVWLDRSHKDPSLYQLRDMRRGFDGLSGKEPSIMKLDPLNTCRVRDFLPIMRNFEKEVRSFIAL